MTARVLLLDIETAPAIGFVWGKYDQNVIEFVDNWYILSFAYKWLGDKEVVVKGLCDYRRKSQLIKDLWAVLNEADIVVAHNGDSFDIRRSNAAFLVHDLPPPSGYKTVDTLKVARKHFKFDSNRLNDLAKALGIGTKIPNVGFSLWKGCMEDDPPSWVMMKEYNKQDVVLLEEVYLRLRPWCNHPDVNLYGDKPTPASGHNCPSCGSGHTQRRGRVVARKRRYQRWNCQSCGAWFSGELVKEI